jgi:hypothetical protein
MGNCVAPCTSKLLSTEAHGGLNEQPLHPAGDDNKNGPEGQKRKDRSGSRSSENIEAENFSSSKQAVSSMNTGAGIVRVKLVIGKEELAKLLANGFSKQKVMEDLLVKLQAKLGDQSISVYNTYEKNCGTAVLMSSHRGWKPSLESIPEDKNTNN